ncbi:MAG: glutamine amidotransferase [Patescibacteria group bacterium]|nr:glutamine amidotransferase [Patescibacteria group bacterium]MDE2590361.1 glutamine amidotransferase [Patescibacteria group bacterium]
MNTKYTVTIGWLYPDLMNIYGDRGNIIVLQKRCEWRGIGVHLKQIVVGSSEKELASCDLLMMGGAQDSQQTIVAKDLQKKKKLFSRMIEEEVPGLYICGGFQYLGQYYKEADGTIIDQLGVLDVYTENPGGERLIGNIAVDASEFFGKETVLVGFENHGGRTRLGSDVKPLGLVLKGFGSNAEDRTEGAVYKNSIGTYFHGPILPKNPELADWLIAKALRKKYNREVALERIDDSLAYTARKVILSRLLVHS